VRSNPAIARGVNISQGHVLHPAVAAAFRMKPTPLESIRFPER